MRCCRTLTNSLNHDFERIYGLEKDYTIVCKNPFQITGIKKIKVRIRITNKPITNNPITNNKPHGKNYHTYTAT